MQIPKSQKGAKYDSFILMNSPHLTYVRLGSLLNLLRWPMRRPIAYIRRPRLNELTDASQQTTFHLSATKCAIDRKATSKQLKTECIGHDSNAWSALHPRHRRPRMMMEVPNLHRKSMNTSQSEHKAPLNLCRQTYNFRTFVL